MAEAVARPPIVSQSEWREARIALLQHEKELTKEYDRAAAERPRFAIGAAQ